MRSQAVAVAMKNEVPEVTLWDLFWAVSEVADDEREGQPDDEDRCDERPLAQRAQPVVPFELLELRAIAHPPSSSLSSRITGLRGCPS